MGSKMESKIGMQGNAMASKKMQWTKWENSGSMGQQQQQS